VVTVKSGATLGGTGSVAGAVTVENGGILAPGASAGTFSVGSLILNSTSALKFELGTTSDLVAMAGNLTLDGILDVTALTGFGAGSYTLFQYGGSLTNNGLTFGTMPSGFLYGIDLSTTNYVRLTVSVPDLYWDGPNTTPNGTVNGGTGTWNNTSSNWTTSNGLTNYIWNDQSTAHFAGTVTVGENVGVKEMIFETTGYVLTGVGQLAIQGATLAVDAATNVVAQIGAAITGTGALEKTGAGTITLTASNSYTGGTKIQNGTLAVNSGGSINHGSAEMQVGTVAGQTGTLAIGAGGRVTNGETSVGFGGTGAVFVSGAGALWTVTAVRESLGVGVASTGSLRVESGGSVDVNSVLYLGNNSGVSGTVTVNGSGSSLSAQLVAVGRFGSGVLNLEDGGALTVDGGNGAVLLGSGDGSSGTLNIGTGGLAGVLNAATIGEGGPGFRADRALNFNHTNSITFGTQIQGRLVVNKLGAGTTTLTGNNFYTGATTIEAGALMINGTNSGTGAVTVKSGGTLGGTGSVAGAVTVQNGGILAPGASAGTFSVGSLILNSTSALKFELGTTSDLVAIAGNLTLDGILDVTALTGFGAGSYTLFQYGGSLTNNGLTFGTMPTGFAYAIDLSTTNYVKLTVAPADLYWDGPNTTPNGTVNGGTGTWNNTSSNWTASNGLTNYIWNDQSTAHFAGTAGTVTVGENVGVKEMIFETTGYVLTGVGQLAIQGATLAVDAATNVVAQIGAAITGSGTLEKTGAGTITLTASNSYTGGTTVSEGVLTVADGGAINHPSGVLTVGTNSGQTAVLNILTNGSVASDFAFIGEGSNSVGLVNVLGGAWTNTRAVQIGVNGTGTVNLSNGTVSASLVNVGLGSAGSLNISAGTWSNTLELTIGSSTNGTLNLSGGSLSARGSTIGENGTGTANVSGGTWHNEEGVALGVNGTGNGTLNISGGTITGAAGTVGAFGVGTANVTGGTWSNAGRLHLGVYNEGTLNLSNGTVIASNVLVSGQVGSKGTLNLAGGTLLAGQVSEDRGSGTVIFGGGTLRLTTNQSDLFAGFENGDVILTNNGGQIDTQAFAVATALGLTGNGALTKLGTGTLTLTGSNSYTGGTTISAGTLQIGNGGTNGSVTGDVTNNAALVFNRSDALTFGNVISGSGSLAKLGAGTLTFTGNNTYTGGTLVSAGTLQIGNGGTNGAITGDVTNNAALVFNRSDALTFSNVISGSGLLEKLGAGTLTFTGDNSYTGGTTISAGTLQVGNGGTNGAITGDITNNVALLFNRAGALTFSNVISGSGSLAKLGTGTLTLTAGNIYKGGTTLEAGTLLVGDDLALGSGALQIGGGTTFGVVSGGNVGLSNAVTLLGDVRIAADALSVLDFEGTVDLGAASRTVTFTEDSSSVCFVGAISGAGGLNFVMGAPGLSGDVTFCGPDDNTYAGLTRVGDGVQLGLEKDPGAIAIAGDLLIDVGGAVTLVDSSEQINPASTVTVNGIMGILSISGTTTQTIGNLQGTGSIINIAGPAVLTVNSGNFGGTILDGGAAPLALFKASAGTLTLGGASAYVGGTLINEGTLRTTSQTALGTGPVGLGGGTLAPTGQLDVASLDWTGGVIASALGTVTSLVNIAGNLQIAKSGGVFDLTAGPGFTPNTFYNILNAANLDDALMALISGNPVLGLNPVFTRVGTSLLVNFAGSSTGPVLQNIGGPWTPVTANFLVNGPVVTGAPADNNTVNSLVFAPNGQLQVFNNLTVTSGVFDVASGNAGLAGGSVLVPGTFSKTGAGTLQIGSNFLVQGAANLTGGQMMVNGQFTAPGGFNVFGNALLGGSGLINGSVINNGIVAPGNSPGTLTVSGNYTQSAAGTLQLEIASTSLFDRLVVGGTANLAGTLAVQDTGGGLAYGQQYDFLQAAAISGTFDQITMPSPERYRGRVLTNGGTGTLLIAPTSYTLVAATANQRSVAGALDAYIPATGGDRETVSIALDRLDASQLPAALDQIAPTFHESLADIAIEQTFAMMQMLNQRMGSTRLGTRSFEASGMESQPLAYDKGGQRTADPKDLKNVVVQEVDPRWSLWTQGSGMFAKVTSANQVPSHGYDGGAVLLGADYTFGDARLRRGTSALTAGVFGGYQGYYARYDGGGRTTANSAVFGAYASLTKGGFYADSVVSGGYGNFKVLRPIDFSTIDRTARSSQDSGQFSASVNLGHDWQAGNFTFGPIAGAQYTYVGIAPFTERGADSLNLRLDQQDANSLRSTLGGRLAYTWKVSDKVAIIPEGRMFWVHEFLNGARSIDAALDSGAGPTFGYMTSDPTRDSVFCGAGVTAQFGENLTTSAYWNVDFGRTDFVAQFLSLNVGWKF
jgi:fibronectin-binding autotransporter adhesin